MSSNLSGFRVMGGSFWCPGSAPGCERRDGCTAASTWPPRVEGILQPSPSKLKANTATSNARPGNVMNH